MNKFLSITVKKFEKSKLKPKPKKTSETSSDVSETSTETDTTDLSEYITIDILRNYFNKELPENIQSYIDFCNNHLICFYNKMRFLKNDMTWMNCQ